MTDDERYFFATQAHAAGRALGSILDDLAYDLDETWEDSHEDAWMLDDALLQQYADVVVGTYHALVFVRLEGAFADASVKFAQRSLIMARPTESHRNMLSHFPLEMIFAVHPDFITEWKRIVLDEIKRYTDAFVTVQREGWRVVAEDAAVMPGTPVEPAP